jgi:plastocyanin
MTLRSTMVTTVTAVISLLAASPALGSTAARVDITDRGFTPDTIEVRVGDVVEWWNADTIAHTVTAENGSFDFGPMEPGTAFSLTFDAAGTYTYTSTAEGDEGWIATVIVGEASGPEEATGEEPPGETVVDPEPSPPAVEEPEELPQESPGVEEAPAADGSPPAALDAPTVASEGLAASSPVETQGSVSVAQTGPTVTVVDSAYQPREVEVSPGTTVVWQQEGELPHTVTADDGSFDSGTMGQGDTFSRTFPQAGTFPYYCEFHGAPGGQGMAGVVIVSGGDGGGGPAGGGSGPGATDPTEGDATTEDSLADTGAPVLPTAIAMTGLLVAGMTCLVIDRRRQHPSRRAAGFERHCLVPSSSVRG